MRVISKYLTGISFRNLKQELFEYEQSQLVLMLFEKKVLFIISSLAIWVVHSLALKGYLNTLERQISLIYQYVNLIPLDSL